MSVETVGEKDMRIGAQWVSASGDPLQSTSPVDDSVVWAGRTANASDVSRAAASARAAFAGWAETPAEQRIATVRRFAELVHLHANQLAELISRETGKPLWESKTEAAAVAGKAALAIDALQTRRSDSAIELDQARAVTRFKPYGVLGVLGPFNFPAHLPNGHIIPAILAGNTVVFKPSEQAPAVGQWMVEKWIQAELPAGVVNLVQGGRTTGSALASEPQLDGLLFTGSSAAGKALHQLFAKWPQKILALEMGGNNPLVVHSASDLDAAAFQIVQSAFLTAGQRCTCARRLILVQGPKTEPLIGRLLDLLARTRVGFWNDQPEPFMGTVISAAAAARLLETQQRLIDQGASSIRRMETARECPALLTPGLIDVTELGQREDEEVFGPLLQIIRVPDLPTAIDEANNTAYGLAAGLISDDHRCYQQFFAHIRAGVVNWNRPTTGASGKLPFGGWGLSGNNRPSGYYAADYCSWPVASMESEILVPPAQVPVGIDP